MPGSVAGFLSPGIVSLVAMLSVCLATMTGASRAQQPAADGNTPASAAQHGRQLKRQARQLLRRHQWRAAAESFWQAITAFTSARKMHHRRALLQRLRKPAPGWPRQAAARFAALWKLENNLDKLLRRCRRLPRRSSPPADVDATLFELTSRAVRLADQSRSVGDHWCQARALQAQARLAAASGYPADEEKKLLAAVRACDRGNCPGLAAELLTQLSRRSARAGDLAEAYRRLARANAQALLGLDKSQRRYRRSRPMIRLCRRLRRSDPQACLRLELEATGFATFTDFSRRSLPAPPGKQQLAEVHAQYLPLLHYCLNKSARAEEVAAGDSFELFWAVTNQGRSTRFHIEPAGRAPQLEACLRKALKLFRYPRYRGERRTVTVPLVVGGG